MPDIKDSVGQGGRNAHHDVAMVEALLTVVTGKYMNGYDGLYSDGTRRAIAKFQNAHNLAAPYGTTGGAANLKSGAAQEKEGFVAPNGPTMQKLNALLANTAFKELMVIPGTKVVYWPGNAGDAVHSAKAVRANKDLEPSFRENVAKLVDAMYRQHKIVLSIARKGGLRTFEEQYKLATVPKKDKHGNVILNKHGNPVYPTGAGPGESNHNFGMAVDIGFNGLKHLTKMGRSAVTDWWLHGVEKTHTGAMWIARNKIAKGLSLHETSLPGDLIHLQNFDDKNINTRASLAKLLNVAGAMKWQVRGQVYSSDFGLGKGFHPVGKSEDVWGLKSNVSATVLANAQKAAGKQVAAGPTEVTAMKQSLKADFEAAEANRFKWVPLP